MTPTTPSTYLAPRQAAGYVSGYGCVVWLALCLTSRSACRLRWCQVLAVLCGYPLDFTICLQSAAAAEPCSWDLWLQKKRALHKPLVPTPPVGPTRVNSGRSESARAHQNQLVPHPNQLSPIGTTRPPSEPPGSHPNHLSPIGTPWVLSVCTCLCPNLP